MAEALPRGLLPADDLGATRRTVEAATTGVPTMPATPAPKAGASPALAPPLPSGGGAPRGELPAGPAAAQTPSQPGQRTLSDEVLDRPSASNRGIFGLEKGTGPAANFINALGDFIIPDTAVGWASVFLTGGPAGRAALKGLNTLVPVVGRAVSRLPQPVQRVVLGALTTEIASDLIRPVTEGKFEPGRGLVEGGAGGVLGEGAAKVIGAGGRKVGHAVGKLFDTEKARTRVAQTGVRVGQQAAAAEKVAETQAKAQTTRAAASGALAESRQVGEQLHKDIREKVPVLGQRALAGRGAAAAELSDLGSLHGFGREDLGQYMTAATADAAKMLPNGAGTKLHIPAMARPNPAWGPDGPATQAFNGMMAANGLLGVKGPTAAAVGQTIKNQLAQVHGPPEITQFTLPEIAQHLKDLGQSGWALRGSAKVMDPRVPGTQSRGTYGDVMADTQTALTDMGHSAAWDTFREGRHAFSVGNAIIDVLAGERAFDRSMGLAAIDWPGLQRAARGRATELKRRMSADEWSTFESIVFPKGLSSQSTTGKIGTLHRTAQAAEERAAEAVQRANRLTNPTTTYPWGPNAWNRVFLNAGMTKALHDAGVLNWRGGSGGEDEGPEPTAPAPGPAGPEPPLASPSGR